MELTILQQIILGVIQGITEWLPLSSSAMIALVMSNLFNMTNLTEILHSALFLHLGTFLAALIYFRKDVWYLIKSLFNYKKANKQTKNVINFLIISTIITGIIGIVILKSLGSFEQTLDFTGKTITFLVAVLLLFTGVIQIKIKSKNRELRDETEIKNNDSVILGFFQGLASLPGISRSGITVSTLLLKKFDDTTALRLSFLMSLPVILFGNLILNFDKLSFTGTAIYGLFFSFILGIATIHGLMKLSRKINFGWFVLIFGLIMLISLLI